LSQQEEPSSGCAQHAPSLSSGFSLGVQHTEALFLGAQHDEASVALVSLVSFDFCNTGISIVSVFIVFECFSLIKTRTLKRDAGTRDIFLSCHFHKNK
jgi:hypothetical protein